MPINVKIITTNDFIRTTATGVLDIASSKQAILDIAAQITQPGEYELLLDTRTAESVLSTNDLYQLGEALSSHPALRRSRIAILGPALRAEDMGFLETVAVNRGVAIKVFTVFEQAISWLIMQEKTP